jgi:hypothetical protein
MENRPEHLVLEQVRWVPHVSRLLRDVGIFAPILGAERCPRLAYNSRHTSLKS